MPDRVITPRPIQWRLGAAGLLAALALTACASLPGVGPDAASLAARAPASEALYAPPSTLGLDATALETFDAVFAAKAAASERAGYVAMIGRGDKIGHVMTVGYADISSGAAMQPGTLFRIASMTKPVTAVAAMSLVEDGLLSVSDPVSKYIPAFADVTVAVSPMADAEGVIATRAPKTEMTVEDLLLHTGGLGYIFDPQSDLGQRYLGASLYAGEGDLEAKINQLASMPLYFDPGERWLYSYAQDVLGRVIEVAAGKPFQDVLAERIFVPLGMTDTTFFPTAEQEARLATLYAHHPEYGIVEAFSDTNPEYRPTWASGGGGLISSAEDYMRFALMLANGGALGDARILQPETMALMLQPHVKADRLPPTMVGMSYGYGLGVIEPVEDPAKALGIPGDFRWGGAFDTDFFVSPATGLVAVIMTQEAPSAERVGGNTAATFSPLVYATVKTAQ